MTFAKKIMIAIACVGIYFGLRFLTQYMIKHYYQSAMNMNAESSESRAENSFISTVENKQQFDELIERSKEQPVVIKVSAVWCSPCKKIKPVYEAVANELHDKIKFAQIDLDQFEDKEALASVSGVPTLLFYKNGQERFRNAGFVDEQQLKDQLKKLEFY